MKHWLTALFLVVFHFGYSQNEANIWYFGDQAGLDFNSGEPVPLLDSQMTTQEGCASIADANGNLLFYTDGVTIWNKDHQVMENGDGLLGDFSSSQSGIIVPRPNSDHLYYVFTVDASGGPDGLNYNLIDMNLQSGFGEVIEKNIHLVDSTTEKLTAVLHENQEDIWVLTHSGVQDVVLAYLVTEDGVNSSPISSPVSPSLVDDFITSSYIGCMKSSPNGEFVAMAHAGSFGTISSSVSVYQFNPSSGHLTNEIIIDNIEYAAYGVEFSPSSEILYVSDAIFYNNRILQYNMEVFNYDGIINSTEIIFEQLDVGSEYPEDYNSMQLGPDGRIYIALYYEDLVTETRLSVINNPDVVGLGCDYEDQVIGLGTGLSRSGLPTFIQSFFNIRFQFENLCFGDDTQFTISNDQVLSAVWDFGDPASGANNTSTELNPIHEFTAVGTYTVTLTATNSDGDTDIYEQEVEIYPNPMPNDNITFTVCSGSDTATFPLSDIDTQVSNDLANESVTYYASAQQAEEEESPLTSPHSMQDGILYARTENNSTGCFTVTTVNVDVNFPIPISNAASLDECVNEDGEVTFTLTDANDDVTAEDDVTITYHNTQADAEEGSNTLPEEVNTAQTVYARVINDIGCYSIAEVTLTAHDLPVVSSLNQTYCSDQPTQSVTFSDFEDELSSDTDVEFSYHLTEQDAIDGENAIPDNYDVGSQTIYVRVENDNNCYRVTTIDFTVNPFPLVGDNTSDVLCFAYNQPNQANVILGDYNAHFNLQTGQVITYHATEQEAMDDVSPVSQSESQTITTTTTYWVRVENSNQTCELIRELELTIEPSWSVENASDQDCMEASENTVFDLEALGNTMVTTPTDFTFGFYRTTNDAQNEVNEIADPSNYSTNQSETIFVNIENSQGCILQGEIALQVNENPQPETLSDILACSTSSEGIFDLAEARTQLNPTNQDWDIQFYANTTDADNEQNALPNSHSSANGAIIVVVTDNQSDCKTQQSIQLTVNDYPTANTINESYCALETPVPIDLTALGGQVSTDQVSFYETEANAENNTSPLTNEWTIDQTAVLYARVENDHCFIVEPVHFTVQAETRNQLPRAYTCIGDTIDISPSLQITETGLYEVEDIETCSTTIYDYEFQQCENDCIPHVPTAFSPNGDGVNETFKIFTPNIGNCQLIIENILIYNRWGELVYEGTEEWDGTFNGESQQGLYLYHIEYSAKSNRGTFENQSASGSVMLID